MAIVMDEYGGTAGLITIEDLFEEVVGEIDERGSLGSQAHHDDQGRLRVSGAMRLDEVGERLGIVLEHDEVVTVSGLILMLLDRQPKVGDSVTFGRVLFEVAAVEGHGVDESIVSLHPPG
jgi:CBS domain containing-hemolysin-like protein